MEAILDSLSEASNALNQEILVLRQKEIQWRQDRENFLQREKWWQHQWQRREIMSHAKELHLMQTHSLTCDILKQLQQDFEKLKKDSKEREDFLVNLISRSESHQLIAEMKCHSFDNEDSQTTEDANLEQPCFESTAMQTTEEANPGQQQFESMVKLSIEETRPEQSLFESTAMQTTEEANPGQQQFESAATSGDNDEVVLTFGDIPEELQFWKDPSVVAVEMITPKKPTTKISKKKPKKIKSTQQVLEDADQAKEKMFAEQWEQRERAWEKQWSEAKLDHQNTFKIWKSLYELRIQELELAAEESRRREEHLSKMLQDFRAKRPVADAPCKEESKTTEEAKPDQSSNTILSGNDLVVYTFGDIPEEQQLWNDPSVKVVDMVPAKTCTTKRSDKKSKKIKSTQPNTRKPSGLGR